MADELRHLDHLYIIERAADEDFHRGGQGNPKIRPVEHRAHGLAVGEQLDQAFSEADQERHALSVSVEELRALGTVIVLEGTDAAYPLQLDSLNRHTKHRKTPRQPMWLLLSVHPATDDEPERATVWVADAHRAAFLKLFEDYLTQLSTKAAQKNWTTPDGNPANQALVANIGRIRRAILEDLWTSADEPPRSGTHWWELWLEAAELNRDAFDKFLATYRLRSVPRTVTFYDRVVVWVQATWEQLQVLPFLSVPIAEIRRPEFIDSFEDLPVGEQNEYVQDLAARITPAGVDAPAVCHLDTGVFRTHLLLRDSLSTGDQHSIMGESGTDVNGHGTSMAGLALYGNLDGPLATNEPVRLVHRLESVRMWPGSGEQQTDPLDYGTATANAVALPEITAARRRVFCLPLSTTPDKPGEPTLWSATVDALATGTDIVRDGPTLRLLTTPDESAARLIVVAAGNVDSYQLDHRAESDTSAIEDPAQAWNALTVAAHTDLDALPGNPDYDGWKPMAKAGELSPHSRTSVMFAPRRWPIKPDICMEGGNVLSDGAGGFEDRHPLFSLRSTGSANDMRLASANATSAAAAQASRLAALTMARYPEYWPETVRGLLTHSAEWTPPMEAELRSKSGKAGRLNLLRRYGWGVPTEAAVLYSTEQAVTLVSQDRFVPFDGDYRMQRFRLHTLPWPADVLSNIGDTSVRLRITLSYFIEPSASRRGWRQRYLYPSHGLRFDLQSSLETQTEFVRRINRDAGDDEEGTSRTGTTTDRWFIGPSQRHLGSLHQDEWTGTGQELAACNSIAVYPTGGWWKNNRRSDRTNLPVRYALIVSLRTHGQDIDLYTPIANELRVPVLTTIAAE
ncbi:S8 family peptidase [Micromonospora sp. WMMD1076]|uniref:S8 family peptidase n=1 Tax=Micromonospora sp. WMMD1076 TaxID=3016103 RepID=UPI00249A976B|nr:S8 family peptidase [Micromonospora sp. WMMD1076]WFF08720.1 S8 family peptidase [Micromonospora sp. WMMD1076]